MPKKKQSSKSAPGNSRQRRSSDQRIAELEARIAAIRERDARRQARSDPALRHASSALKSIDKALSVTKDSAVRKVLGEARATLVPLLGGTGFSKSGHVRRSAAEIPDLRDTLLQYVRSHPGQRGEEIASALATDSGTIRPVMKRLIADGKITTEGARRGMTYSPA